jgi:SAM-dependent methyltransferase
MRSARALSIIAACAIVAFGQEAPPARKPDVVYVPTPPEVVTEMLKLAGVTKDDVVYDLGSGDGRIVIAAAKEFGARGVGVEISPKLVAEARANAERAGVADRVRFVEQDLFAADLREATVVTLYLLPELNLKLRPKLLAELRPGARVVSHLFDMEDWKPDRTFTWDRDDTEVYLWIVPEKPAAVERP